MYTDWLFETAKAKNKKIILAEGTEARVVNAAIEATKKGIARIILLGEETAVRNAVPGADLTGIEIIDPVSYAKTPEYAAYLYELRKEKGLTQEQAEKLSKNVLYFGCLAVKKGDADGLVGGSVNATADVLRPALQIIKGKKGIKTVSSCFIMVLPESSPYGEKGVMIFTDCGVIPNPTSEQLADIAKSGADSARALGGIADPKVALLSFSTKGSAKDPLVDKVTAALAIMKEDSSIDFEYDGELQLDAAIVPSVGAQKAKGSAVAGKASVLVFPDLQAGNIGYKLVQRFGGAIAIGPICQGLASPVNDLSRGCTVEDIVGTVAITALQTL
ncbi:MAG: phosphate acetyltransferase [Christensenellaceae bacterium]|jgi:phosphate acetyltransferase|nr:phosphate acetyltransferase [Christensenellaceae bacterium]